MNFMQRGNFTVHVAVFSEQRAHSRSRASSETSEEAHAVTWKMTHVGTCVGALLDSGGVWKGVGA